MDIWILQPLNINNNNEEKKDLKGLLKLCLLKQIANLLDINNNVINILINQDLKDQIIKIKENIHFTGDCKHNLNENNTYNILNYSHYLNSLFNLKIQEILISIISTINQEKKEYILDYWSSLLKYSEYNFNFENQFRKDLKNCIFDYSLVSMNILERDDQNQYEIKRNECPNMIKTFLYRISNINPDSSIFIEQLKYPKKSKYGFGIIFSDLIDYIASYWNENKNMQGKIIPINKTFSLNAYEIFFDKNKYKKIENENLETNELDHNPSYNELKSKYKDKIVESNGIHFIEIKEIDEENSNDSSLYIKEKGKVLGNEYIITEKNQIFPLYTLTLKRNEYFVLFKDHNFDEKNKYFELLEDIKISSNINIYYEKYTEDALKFLFKRKYNKIILITSIGDDLSGKRFIDIARKIMGFEIMILFYLDNRDNRKDLDWIQNYPNCLCTYDIKIIEEYITNYNENGLKELKKKVEDECNIKLKPFSIDFLLFPNFKIKDYYTSLDFTNRYIKQVYIKNGDNYLYMDENGKVIMSSECCPWDITILDNDITLYSKGFYLDIKDDKENVFGCKYMKKWNFEKDNDYYCFINIEKDNNNILSIDRGEIRVNKTNHGEKEMFQLIDIYEENNIMVNSFLSDVIKYEFTSISFSQLIN